MIAATQERSSHAGFEPEASGIDAEGIEAVHGAPAARHVEARRARTQERRAVLAVDEQVGVALAQRRHPLLEARELLLHERAVVGLRGGEMGHRAGEREAGRVRDTLGELRRERAVPRAQAAHPAVELDVHPARAERVQPVQELLAPGDHVRARGDHALELVSRQRAHHEDRRVDAGVAQLAGLGRRRDRQP